MKQYEKVRGGYLVIDDTSIYEIDLECYQCMTEDEKQSFFDEQDRGFAEKH